MELYQTEIYEFIRHIKNRFNKDISISVATDTDRVEHYYEKK